MSLGELLRAEIGCLSRDFGGHEPDELELARVIATAAIERYGDFDTDETWARFRERGIWNDHPAVQAALIAVRLFKGGGA